MFGNRPVNIATCKRAMSGIKLSSVRLNEDETPVWIDWFSKVQPAASVCPFMSSLTIIPLAHHCCLLLIMRCRLFSPKAWGTPKNGGDRTWNTLVTEAPLSGFSQNDQVLESDETLNNVVRWHCRVSKVLMGVTEREEASKILGYNSCNRKKGTLSFCS